MAEPSLRALVFAAFSHPICGQVVAKTRIMCFRHWEATIFCHNGDSWGWPMTEKNIWWRLKGMDKWTKTLYIYIYIYIHTHTHFFGLRNIWWRFTNLRRKYWIRHVIRIISIYFHLFCVCFVSIGNIWILPTEHMALPGRIRICQQPDGFAWILPVNYCGLSQWTLADQEPIGWWFHLLFSSLGRVMIP